MNGQKGTPKFSKPLLVVAGLFLSLTCTAAQETPARSFAEVDRLFPEVASEAMALERDCDAIADWTNEKQVRWQSLVEELQLIREHINLAGRLVSVLQAERESASPRQQRAIDHICPLLRNLAVNTQEILNHFSDSRCRSHISAQRDYVRAGAKLARDLSFLICVYVGSGERESERDRSKKSPTQGDQKDFLTAHHNEHGKVAGFVLLEDRWSDDGLKLSRDENC